MPNVVVDRLKAYHELTEPLIEYYQGPHYHRIDGEWLITAKAFHVERQIS